MRISLTNSGDIGIYVQFRFVHFMFYEYVLNAAPTSFQYWEEAIGVMVRDT